MRRGVKQTKCRECGTLRQLVYKLYRTDPDQLRGAWSYDPLKVVSIDVRLRAFRSYQCPNRDCVAFGLYGLELHQMEGER